MGFPGGSVVKNLPVSAEDAGSILGSGRSPGERKWQPTPVFLPGKSHGLVEPGRLQSMGSQRVTQLSNFTLKLLCGSVPCLSEDPRTERMVE